MSSVRYVKPKPAPLPADFDEFFSSLTESERELHQLATEWLASSYFVQWVPLYKNWSKKKAEAQKAEAQKAEAQKAEAQKAEQKAS
jgi:hypothetical protein